MSLINLRKVPNIDSLKWILSLPRLVRENAKFVTFSLLLMIMFSYFEPELDPIERGYFSIVDLLNTFLFPLIPIALTGLMLTRALGLNKGILSVVFNLKIIYYSLISSGLIVFSLAFFLGSNPQLEEFLDIAIQKNALVASIEGDKLTSDQLLQAKKIQEDYNLIENKVEESLDDMLMSFMLIMTPLIIIIFYSLVTTLPMSLATGVGIIKSYALSFKSIFINPLSTLSLILLLVANILFLGFLDGVLFSVIGTNVDFVVYPLMVLVSSLLSVSFTESILVVEVKK